MIRFTVEDNGEWKVTHHVTEHNHYFAKPHERHLIRSARKVTREKALIMHNLVNSGNKISNAYDFLAKDAQGEENLGFTKKDCYNHLNQAAQKCLEAGDAQSLIDYFKSKQLVDPMFYYSFQVDQNGRLTNVFWRDGKSMLDYEAFGDVFIYDNPYRTNKYDMICAPFVGVNHHGKNVMFGCAFLFNEGLKR
ncbi:protein FAR1-RELATED SEQUENCE 5-like [Silene latifolia]|uniref:protein FAR1-RELATED SEQUENCE 5-like n=1 Tax=Silene latifolia TaxID=37657 RepID=UPI003D78010D